MEKVQSLTKKRKSYGCLNLLPERELFKNISFYSSLENKIATDKEHEDIKKLCILINMRNTIDLNDLHNFQDMIFRILCEIFKS